MAALYLAFLFWYGGREFWMVNLIKLREKALYPETGVPAWGDDPMEANARYSRAMVPWLLKHGGHPIFGTVVAGRFIDDARGEAWDQVLAVRYRSRRDMLRMVINLAAVGALLVVLW